MQHLHEPQEGWWKAQLIFEVVCADAKYIFGKVSERKRQRQRDL